MKTILINELYLAFLQNLWGEIVFIPLVFHEKLSSAIRVDKQFGKWFFYEIFFRRHSFHVAILRYHLLLSNLFLLTPSLLLQVTYYLYLLCRGNSCWFQWLRHQVNWLGNPSVEDVRKSNSLQYGCFHHISAYSWWVD